MTIHQAVHAIEAMSGAFDPEWGAETIATRRRLADITAECLIDDPEYGDGWAFINEAPRDFQHNGWVLKAQENGVSKLTRADGSDIYVVKVDDALTSHLSWLDRA